MQNERPCHERTHGAMEAGLCAGNGGELWNENEHPDWKEGHSKAEIGMLMGRLPDRHGLLIRQEQAYKQAQHDKWMAEHFPGMVSA